ncbi:MAG: biotin synthase BioB [Elusimicrobia bacterium RIFOXYA2_FULL_39_19]|nr:MAG: biotin synthase BioB [Elusimicrobia bacterium RIFOXYA2_FULL_39_19]
MNLFELIQKQQSGIFPKDGISFDDAFALTGTENKDLYFLFALANSVREKYRGNKVNLCALTNAKSGNCTEDCKFCSQSAHHNSKVEEYPLINEDEIVNQARETINATKTNRFCIVISGKGVSEADLDVICNALKRIKKEFPAIALDASLGFVSPEGIIKLKQAGLSRYNHNVETAESHFGKVCTTHKHSDRTNTIKAFKNAGIEACCGGIFGLGETSRQRIEMAFEIKALDPHCIPLNFLNPIPGTALGNNKPLPPLELLKYVAIYRLIMPDKEIRVCGGRQTNLKNLQSMIFPAGADAIIIGNYLTTAGSTPKDDHEMIKSMGLKIENNPNASE